MPVALITGASGGLGESVVEAFGGAGYSIVAVARRWSERGSEQIARVSADLTEAEGAAAAVQAAVERHGRIDAVLHLVGGFAAGKLEETGEEVWERMLEVNLHSARHLLRAAIPVLRGQGGGSVVFVGSRAGEQPAAGFGAYSVSKAALHALVRVAAAELIATGVRVNAVLPSVIDTPGNRRAMGSREAERWVSPGNLASLALWLCSESGRDVTGALIPVYGRI